MIDFKYLVRDKNTNKLTDISKKLYNRYIKKN